MQIQQKFRTIVAIEKLQLPLEIIYQNFPST